MVENKSYIRKCLDGSIYEFRRLYLLSVVKRWKGELNDSDKLLTDAMQHAEFHPAMPMEAWVLVSKAKILEIEIAT